MNSTLDYLASEIASAWRPFFRGQIYEYAAKLDLQAGYAVKGHFDIRTARHLIAPFEAIRDPRVRLVSCQGAVQTLKSLIADVTVPYWIEHDPGDCAWFMEDDPKAKLYAETRCMPLIASVPEIARMLEAVDRSSRTKTSIKLRHMNLVMAGLNEGNVQSISYRYIIIDEAWLAKANGLIRQAKDRTKQYPDTKKIIILGQGGLEDEDADLEHKQTHQFTLHYGCPFCGHQQPFELPLERPEDLRKASNPKTHYAGLAWDTNDITKPGGRWNFEKAAATAHHVCYQCGGRIEDTPAMRRRLNDSYVYLDSDKRPFNLDRVGMHSTASLNSRDRVESVPTAVGFQWPAEASMRVPFAELVSKYLRAKVAQDELAYRLPMKEFYQKDRGLPWSENTGVEHARVIHEAYDALSEWKEERYRVLIFDCQKDLKKFFCGVYAMATTGETRELYRGAAGSFEEIGKLQKKWRVKDECVFADCGYEMTKVLRECVRRGHWKLIKRADGKQVKYWACWTGLKGSGAEMFHVRVGKESLYRIVSERKFYNTNVGTQNKDQPAPFYLWSNLHCKDLMKARRDGDPSAPKFLFLPDELAASDPWSHWQQMHSEVRRELYRFGKKSSIWELVKQTRPNHEWDKASMVMAFQAIVGIIGSAVDPVENQVDNNEATK